MELTPRFDAALALARFLHRTQKRKGSETPYLAHLLSTSALVMHFGGTEAQACAALLHDAAEDQGGTPMLEAIRVQLGADVADIVADCTDAVETPKPEWRPRKERYVHAVAKKPAASLLVTACDKLDNARAIVADLRRDGRRTPDRFTGGAQVLWYYAELAAALRAAAREPGTVAVVNELDAAVAEMKALAEGT
jgi:(p)ppGpp synthase/HD superfamily hydrolase